MNRKAVLILVLIIIASFELLCNPITGSIEAGYIPLEGIRVLERSVVNYDNYFYIDFSLRYTIYCVFVGGSVKTFMSLIDGYVYFDPQEAHYRFEAGLKLYNFEAGFRHFCCHPVITYLSHKEVIRINYEGSYEEIYIKLNF